MTSWNHAPWDRGFVGGYYAPPVVPPRRWPSFGRVVISLFVVASAVCWLASVALAFGLAVHADAHTSPIAGVLVSFGVFLFHGPYLVLAGWPISVPVILALGGLLAYLRRRPSSASGGFAAARRIGFALLIGYGILLTAAWTVLLLGAI